MINNSADTLFPLSEFYNKSGTSLPEFEIIDTTEIPEPYNQLLVHNEDMTSALRNYHKQSIHLDLIELFEEKGRILRKVALILEDGTPIESGAIQINLDRFPDGARTEILASHLPLGAILQKYEVDYASRPEYFFKIQSDDFIGRALKLPESRLLYGRINQLTNQHGEPLAHVVEILPPLDQLDQG